MIKECEAISAQNNRIFTFAEIRKYGKIANMRSYTQEANEFYVFKRDLHDIQIGQIFYLEMDDFTSYYFNENKIFYNKNEFSESDINELKTYTFN
jgi:hypothetical protein